MKFSQGLSLQTLRTLKVYPYEFTTNRYPIYTYT